MWWPGSKLASNDPCLLVVRLGFTCCIVFSPMKLMTCVTNIVKVIARDSQDSVIKDIHGSLCLALLGHWLQGRPAVIPCGSSSSPVGRSTWGGTQDPPWGVELPVQSSLQMTLQPLLTSWLQTHERYGARTTQLSHCQVPDLQDCEILNGHVVSHYVLDY